MNANSELTDVLQTVLEALPVHAAVLDSSGCVLASNRAGRWLDEAIPAGDPFADTTIGANLLQSCQRAAAAGDGVAASLCGAIQAVMQEPGRSRQVEYTLPDLMGPRRFRVRLARAGGNGTTRVVVWHEEIGPEPAVDLSGAGVDALSEAQHAATLGRMAVGVAHNFNNMLTVLLGHTDSLAMRLERDPSAAAQIGKVRNAALKAATLAQQLLDFGRRDEPRIETFDLNAIVLDLRDLLEQACGKRTMMKITLGAGPCKVRAEPAQIEQVIVNLALNGRDAMPAGGTLSISTAHADCACPPEEVAAGPFVVLSVQDSGRGIDPAVRARLFEPFFTTKPAGKGTGLGLYSVDRIVRRYGGFVTVESAPRAGACFRIHLPDAASIDEISVAAGSAAR
jgi:signal transduction histidine kinase